MQKLKCVSANQLKAVAIAAMLADHLAWWLLDTMSAGGQLVHFIGRLTAPLMCWFIVQGYIHTSNIRKYLLRMLAFALISHFPYVMYFGYEWYKTTSVIWTLFIGLLALYVCDKHIKNPALEALFLILCCALVFTADWSYVAVLWIFAFYRFRENNKLQLIWFSLIGLALYSLPAFISSDFKAVYPFGFLLAIPFLYMYNGKRGIRSLFTKWVFYVFYPLHLLILALMKYVIFPGL